MSYDTYLTITVDTGSAEGPSDITISDIGNMTFNVGGMFNKALGFRFTELDGKLAGAVSDQLSEAVEVMERDPETFKAMEPENGWGSYEGALQYLHRLRIECIRNPKTTIKISY